MDAPITKLARKNFPPLLTEIPDYPKDLYVRGILPPQGTKCLAVVGSRNYTDYGKRAVDHLIGGLQDYPVAIISGLALGIDGLAHEAALRKGLYTLAVPGSGLHDSVLYPRKHRGLAGRILESGGGLLSEFEPTFRATTWSFPQRNRIMAGLAHAVLIIEAAPQSGTLITARLATEYNRELLVVPGSIFSENSKGTHQFLKLGATPVTEPSDLLDMLDINTNAKRKSSIPKNLSEEFQGILECLNEPKDRDTLIRMLDMPAHRVGILLTQMELEGYVRDEGGTVYKVV